MQLTSPARIARSMLCAVSTVALAAVAIPATAQAQTTQDVSISAQPLGDALIEIGQRYNTTIVVLDSLVSDITAPRVSGSLTLDQALARVLAGTGLSARPSGDGYVIVDPAGAATADSELIVTGTRIERTAANSPSPIDIITFEELASLGLTDVTEAIRFVPALQQSLSLTAPFNFGRSADTIPPRGFANLDLRGLGAARTLVLVNGRRHVGGNAGEATVDINTISPALIDRVEVLTGGGSSIYGADAVSGVVNYVLKDNFEGIDFRGGVSLPTDGGGEAYRASVTIGTNTPDDRGNAVLSVDYLRQTNLAVREREVAANRSAIAANNPALAAVLGVDASFLNVVVPDARQARFTPDGSFSFNGNSFGGAAAIFNGTTTFGGFPILQLFDSETGQVRPVDVGVFADALTSLGGDGVLASTFNPDASIVPDTEQFIVNALASYDVTGGVTAFLEAKYSRSEARSVEAIPLNPINYEIRRDNAFLPQEVRNQFDAIAAQGLNPSISLTRSVNEAVANDPAESVRDTFRIVGGLRGEVSSAFHYEISANYGRTDTSLIDNNEPLPDRFLAATDAVVDPVTGNIVCRIDIDPNTPLPSALFPRPNPGLTSFAPGDGSCVPVNLFGQGSVTAEAADFFLARTEVEFELEQFVLNAVIDGNSEDFFELPAGPISYALGAEYREERSAFRPDPLQIAGLGFFGAFQDPTPVAGNFDVTEIFGEVSIPILADQPFARSLTIDGSIRYADYSTVGSATSFAFGGNWEPVAGLRLRGSFNRAVRAPNINELFIPQQVVPGQLAPGSDPCDPNGTTTGSATRAANCALLVPDNFDPTPSYQSASTLETRGGNPGLSEETADTFTIGFVVQPVALPGFSLVVDYYNIDIEDGVQGQILDEVIVRNCADAPTIENNFCAAVTRNPTTGVVEAVQATTLNLSAIQAQGIDYDVRYSFDLEEFIGVVSGVMTAQLAGTYLIEREDVLFQDFPETNNRLDGEYNFPDHFLNFSLSWRNGPWEATYGFNYQASQVRTTRTFGIEDIRDEPLTLANPETGDAFVHYIGGSYDLFENLNLSLRVNNVFDRQIFDGTPGNFGPLRPVSFIGRTVQIGLQGNF